LEWIVQFAEDQGASLLQIHPLEMTGRAVTELPGQVPDSTECLYARIETLRLQKKSSASMRFQCDVVNHQIVAAHPEDFLAGPLDPDYLSRPLAQLVAPLIVEPDGALTPLVYGLPDRFSFGRLGANSLEDLADRWRRHCYPELRDLCATVYQEVSHLDQERFVNWYEMIFAAAHRHAQLTTIRAAAFPGDRASSPS
jgi:hypothetical protein